MNDFKQRLFSEQPELDDIKASAMLDCYFMTIIAGLNEHEPQPDKMLRLLTNKLSILQDNLFHSVGFTFSIKFKVKPTI